MSQPSDAEHQEWSALWQGGDNAAPARNAALAAAVRRRGRRQNLFFHACALAEGLVCLGLLAFGFDALRRLPAPEGWMLAVVIWLLTLGAGGFSFWNRRGIWRPSADTPAAFLDLARRRCQRRLAAARFALYLLLLEVLLFIPWFAWLLQARPQALRPERFVYAGLVIFVAVVSIAGYRWWVWRQLRQVEVLERELEDGEGGRRIG